jgi:hypothetical protein
LATNNERSKMTKRIQKLVVAVAALAALALGGAAFASAQSSPSTAPERTSAPDRDNIQSGDQTTPDRPAVKARHQSRHHAVLVVGSTNTGQTDTGNVQSGDQTTPDAPGTGSETPGAETPGSESAPGNDGPGGHADEPGNASADHQFQGNE